MDKLTPLKAIRAKCLDCCCGQSNEVKLCPCADCPLYIYRLGKGPKRERTEKQKAADKVNAQRLRKINYERETP